MSRRVILTLIVLMAVVMASLVFVQTNSITSALAIKKEQFNQMVNNVLLRTTFKMEQEELAEIRMANSLSNSANSGSKLFPKSPGFDNIVPRAFSQAEVSISFQYSGSIGSTSINDDLSISYGDSISSKQSERGRPGEFPSGFDRLNESNSYWKQQYQDRLDQQISYLAMNQLKLQVANLPIGVRIDPQKLDNDLRRLFRDSGIDLDFEYAIKSSFMGNEELVLKTNGYQTNRGQKEFSQLLFPNDLNLSPNYLYVYFPKQQGYLMKETGLLIIPTIILTAMLIGIFVFTILIILRQKKLSIIKNDFINNMTHELKTPISTISLASQMLRDNSLQNTARTIEQISNVIYQESKRLSFQVEKVLQMAVFNEGKLKLKYKEVNLNELINSVVLNFELRVKNKNGTLSSDLKAEQPVVKADEVHITNVLFNLLDNAVKYSNDEPQILVSTENKKGFLVVSVKDNGIGIPSEHIDQIFERFFRVPTGNVHDVKGFGLGLSYVKKIVESHQGKIKVESTLHKGTKFMIYFPLKES